MYDQPASSVQFNPPMKKVSQRLQDWLLVMYVQLDSSVQLNPPMKKVSRHRQYQDHGHHHHYHYVLCIVHYGLAMRLTLCIFETNVIKTECNETDCN